MSLSNNHVCLTATEAIEFQLLPLAALRRRPCHFWRPVPRGGGLPRILGALVRSPRSRDFKPRQTRIELLMPIFVFFAHCGLPYAMGCLGLAPPNPILPATRIKNALAAGP